MMNKIYPRKGDTQTVYLNAVVKDPSIEIGDYTIYNDFVSDPCLFEQNNHKIYFFICAKIIIFEQPCNTNRKKLKKIFLKGSMLYFFGY